MLNVARTETGEPEIFRSIQGEGPMAGRERAFIRLSGCNLHCRWCDTAYTWNWIGADFEHERDRPGAPYKFDPAQEMVKLDRAEAARLLLAFAAEGVVITGGEPLLQTRELMALIDLLRARATLSIEIETNGSIEPAPELAARVDLFVVSPKLAHSGNDPDLALRALPAFQALPNAIFKFVARDPSDIELAADIARRAAIAADRIYIMPEGTESAVLKERAARLAPAIREAGFHASDRLHIHMFGDKRGV